MAHRNQIILSQLTPPAQKSSILDRPRVLNLLKQSLDYPLTTLVTETGYGKTTSALSLIKSSELPFFQHPQSRETDLVALLIEGGTEISQKQTRIAFVA